MKKSFMILIAISMSFSLMAQEKTKQKELGLTFRNLDNFGLTFKTGNVKSLWRFNTLLLTGNKSKEVSDSLERNFESYGFKVMLGKEFRKPILNDFELRYGFDLSFRYNTYEMKYDDYTIQDRDRLDKTTTYEPGINLIFGFNYVLNDHLVFGAELLPSFSYITGSKTEKTYTNNFENEIDVSGFNFGLSNTSVLLSISYRY